MLNNRLSIMLTIVAMLVVATLSITAGNAVTPASPTRPDLSDYYQRHPGVLVEIPAVASDWFGRHPELKVASAADFSDYYLRHRNATVEIAAVASDWFERHPELKVRSGADLSDYYVRHRDSFKPGKVVDLSDWFQRHPELIIH